MEHEELLAQIFSGRAILFTGAGFSKETKTIKDQTPPDAKELAIKICRLGKFDEDTDLRYATDFYIEKKKSLDDIINLLKESFSIKEVSNIHNEICSAPWRRFYTTNYDNSIVLACASNGKKVESLDISQPHADKRPSSNLCVHINGNIDTLSSQTINSSFKLSSSSYISPQSFLESPWRTVFRSDIDRCSALVFCGYSLYDIEIQKLLVENDDIYRKTYFITTKDIDKKTRFTLSKFGKIIEISTNGLGEYIKKYKTLNSNHIEDQFLKYLQKYEISQTIPNVTDSEIESLLLYGKCEKEQIDNAVVSNQSRPQYIIRSILEDVLSKIKQGKDIIITSGLGNGKTIVCKQLASYLTLNDYDVYLIEDSESDYIGDIELIADSKKNSVIIIDGYSKYLTIYEYFVNKLPRNVSLISTERSATHEIFAKKLNDFEYKYLELQVEQLDENEIDYLVSIFDNIGCWGVYAGVAKSKKIEKIKYEHGGQISLALIDVLNSPTIKDRLEIITSKLFEDGDIKKTVFAISLLNCLSIDASYSRISEISQSDAIYSSSLRRNEAFKTLYSFDSSKVISRSSILSYSLINNNFSPSYVSDSLLNTAHIYDNIASKDRSQSELFKSMLKFSTIERLLPENNKRTTLRSYYEQLKEKIPWLVRDSHYWLQYAMCQITLKDYDRAQKYIDQSYSIAKSKTDYYTTNIDSQQARLYLLKANNETDPVRVFEFFKNAHVLLSALDDDIYKYRQIDKYIDFYSENYQKLNNTGRSYFKRSCAYLVKHIEGSAINRGFVYRQKVVDRCYSNLNEILGQI